VTASGDVPNYAELPLGCFLDMVASREPAPGGGASAAVAVALAAALSGMAARLSADYLTDANGLAERAECLRQRVAPLAQEDATAYRHVLAAYRVPDGEEGPGIRRERTQKALSDAADVPLNIAEAGPEVGGVATRLAREGNPNLRGDAVAAALLAEAGVRAAAVLVEIDTTAGGLVDDRLRHAGEFATRVAGATRGIAAEGEG